MGALMKVYFQPILFGELKNTPGKVQTVVSKAIFNTYPEAEQYVPTFIMALEDQGIVFLKDSLNTMISELNIMGPHTIDDTQPQVGASN